VTIPTIWFVLGDAADDADTHMPPINDFPDATVNVLLAIPITLDVVLVTVVAFRFIAAAVVFVSETNVGSDAINASAFEIKASGESFLDGGVGRNEIVIINPYVKPSIVVVHIDTVG